MHTALDSFKQKPVNDYKGRENRDLLNILKQVASNCSSKDMMRALNLPHVEQFVFAILK